jgi:multiple sugar transport system permease protein
MTAGLLGIRNKLMIGLLLALPFLYLGIMYIYPLSQLVYMSLRDFQPAFATDDYVGWQNYLEIFTSPTGRRTILRTLLYTGVCVVVSFLLGLAYALLTITVGETLSRRWETSLRQVIILPMLFIPAASAVMWSFAYTEHYGWVNHLLHLLSFPTYPWLVSDAAFYLVMLTDIWGWTPFLYLILLAGLQTLPQEPLDAAKVDGAGAWQTFWYVVLPLLRPVILIALTIKTLDTYRAFDYLWIMSRGGPGETSTTLNIMTYKTAFQRQEFGLASAYGVVTMLFPLLVVFLFLGLRRKVTA